MLLCDSQIEQRNLITDQFDPSLLRGCCYEFRAGCICYVYNYESKTTRQIHRDLHVIQPMETVTIITMEKVTLDKSHFLSLWAKGSLFSVGLSPVCTAADPGFEGNLGITLTNLSTRPISLQAGTRFIKGAFFQLDQEASYSYVGQHGDAKLSWPYPSQFHTEPPDFDSFESSSWSFLPPPVKQIIARLQDAEKYIRWVIYMFTGLLLVNVAQFLGGAFLTDNVRIILERSFALIGSFASIIGLFMAITLWQKR